ncbi:uncharacterized protein [Nicotiana tomentosiformis]|uniref:uncharacterized protein n=1 Tax=Nicotiana tomentosiformis TaxID=4098 RepID=UPI00388C392C
MFRKVKSLEQSLKNMQGIGSQLSVAYKDLCLFSDVQLPAGFKMPKFDPYDGHGDHVAHLRGFCSNMRGAGGKDELLMAYFSQSLSGAALEWLRQLDVLRPIEPKIPNPPPRNLDYSLRCAYCSNAPGHDTEKCWHLKRAIQELIDTNQIVVQSPKAPNINQNPLSAHAETHMIEIVHKDGEPKNSSKSIMMIRASESNPIKALDSAKAMSLTVKGVSEKPSTLNVKPSVLVVKGPPVGVEANQERQKVVMPGVPGKPVIIVEGVRVTPVIIKPVTQLPMVDTKAVPWNYKQVIVTYKGKEVEDEVNETGGLTHSGRCFAPEELRKTKPFKDGHVPVKKPVTEEEAEEFLKKMKMQDYSIVEQLRKIPAQISLLSLLIHSDEHRKALMKILNEAHVPDKITLKIGTERIHINNVCVRGFDGGGKDSVGDIMLNLSIGPVEFTMEFQVLDVAASYNLLLGRPWIHAAKAIPSSLHQMVKFEWDRQEIVVHGDENLSAYNDTIIPFIEVEDDKGPWVYQMFETVSVGKIPEGECILGPKIPSASVMVANEMLKNSFLPGKGLGSSLQGIVHPVCPCESFSTFGLGFTLTGKDVKKAKSLKGKAWSLPKPVPHISKSFVKPGVAKRPISAVPKPVVDFDEELIKRFQSLFDEVNMVEIGEGSNNADVQFVGPNVKLSNWKAIPLPIRKEFCSFYAGFNDMTCMRNFQPNLKSQSNSEITIQEVEGDDETEYDEEAAFEEVSRELKHFEEKPKPNLNETEAINLGDQNNVRETKIRRLAKWQILLTEFDIIYVTRTAMKAQALADHLAKNPVDEAYEPLKTYFPDEEAMYVDEADHDEKPGWKLFFDGAANMKGVGIGAVFISETRHHYPVTAQLRFYCTNNMAEYEACILGLRSVEFRHIPKIHNEIADALATLASMLHHPDEIYVDPLHIQIRDQHAYCNMVEEELDGEPWFHDVEEYIKSGVYPAHATGDQKRTIRRLASGFFLSRGILYKRTPDLGLLRCIDAKQASTIMAEVHSGVCGPHMSGYVLTKKILRAGYYWLTMERDCISFVCKCHQFQVYGDLIHSPPSELHTMSAPWPFVAWGMDVIRPIEPAASNEHRFILVAIDYFTKWVEAVTFKSVTKKAVVDFVHSNIICRFGIPKIIITDNAANLNSHLMKEANGAVEAANKNIKKILHKMVQGSRQWHEKLPFALLGYRTTVRTSIGATPYLLVYGTEAVIPAKVEIPSLRVIVENEIDNDEWVKTRLEQLSLIDEKRLAAVCHGQLYQRRMARA